MKDWVQSLSGKLEGLVEAAQQARRQPEGAASKPSERGAELVSTEPRPEKPPVVAEDLPVVARLVVEIRSDGTRTTARGAMEDLVSGQRTAVQASGGSPVQLAASLASSLLSTPRLVGQVAGAALRSRVDKMLGKKR